MIHFDKASFDFECSECRFYNAFTLKQARLRDVVICRACKANIHLDDRMNECRKAARLLKKSLREIRETFERINRAMNA